jgi:hypothetical protein
LASHHLAEIERELAEKRLHLSSGPGKKGSRTFGEVKGEALDFAAAQVGLSGDTLEHAD